jgi:hypothetical protein
MDLKQHFADSFLQAIAVRQHRRLRSDFNGNLSFGPFSIDSGYFTMG